MVSPKGFVPPSNLETAWLALCEDSDASVLVCNHAGELLFANRKATRWLRWQYRQLGGHSARTPDGPVFIQETCQPDLLEERLALGQRVCSGGKGLTYESLYHGIRFRITMRPLPTDDGTNLVLIVSRQMHPAERITRDPDNLVTPIEVEHHDAGVIATLSTRELEVLILIGEGLSYAEIGNRLHRSVRTIERHRDHLGQKLGATNRVQLARFAIRAGLCEMPTPPEQDALNAADYDPLSLSNPVRKIAGRRIKKA